MILFTRALRWVPFRDRWDQFSLRVPIVGRLISLATAAQYLRTLALIIASRQTLRSAADVLAISRYRTEADKVVEAIRAGETLSNALRHLSVVPSVADN